MCKLLIATFFIILSLSNAQIGGIDLKLEFDELKQQLMIEYINLVQNDWLSGVNLQGKALQNAKKFSGTYLNAPKLFATKPKELDAELTIPDTFDSRTQWPNCQTIKEIRDQGNCGSCWAVSAVETMSDRICIASNQTMNIYLSGENMLSCVPDGCEGGDPGSAWDYYIQSGVPTGGPYGTKTSCQPYTFTPCGVSCQHEPFSPTPSCSSTCESSYNETYNQDLHYGGQAYYVDSDVSSIQQEIMKNGPVQATMTVYQDFMTYKSGVYSHVTGEELGGHAIKIIGWGSDNGVAYWLCANSWDTGFGINGFFKIKRGTDECGIEDGILAGTPNLTKKGVQSKTLEFLTK